MHCEIHSILNSMLTFEEKWLHNSLSTCTQRHSYRGAGLTHLPEDEEEPKVWNAEKVTESDITASASLCRPSLLIHHLKWSWIVALILFPFLCSTYCNYFNFYCAYSLDMIMCSLINYFRELLIAYHTVYFIGNLN